MRVFGFAAGLLAAAAIAGGAAAAGSDWPSVSSRPAPDSNTRPLAASPDCSDWPSGMTCAAVDNRGRYSAPGEF